MILFIYLFIFSFFNNCSIIEDYLSSFTISKLSSSEWEEAIAKNYQKLIGKSNMEANVLLFEAIKQLENYGSTVFNVKVRY